jgi:lipopolysaccharide export LptBFGC system permease protein LptF
LLLVAELAIVLRRARSPKAATYRRLAILLSIVLLGYVALCAAVANRFPDPAVPILLIGLVLFVIWQSVLFLFVVECTQATSEGNRQLR